MNEIFSPAIVLWILLLTTMPVVGAQSPGTDEIPVCSAGRTALNANDATPLHVWHKNADSLNTAKNWMVTSGIVESQDGAIVWRFQAAAPGVHHANLKADGKNICHLRIVVVPRALQTRGSNFVTGRGFLLKDQTEPSGYGLYSYLLMGSRPDEENRERYLRVLVAILRLESSSALSKYVPIEELNLTLIPITKKFPKFHALELQSNNEKAYADSADWIIRNYDYARAKSILRYLPGDVYRGPYLVSMRDPKSLDSENKGEFLRQDFSSIPEDLIIHSVREFQFQVQQDDQWNSINLRSLLLGMRISITHVSESMETVRDAGDMFIEIVDKYFDHP